MSTLDRSVAHESLGQRLVVLRVPTVIDYDHLHGDLFNHSGQNLHSHGEPASIGLVDHGRKSVVMLPSLPTLPSHTPGLACIDGFAIGSRTADIWVAKYFNHQVSRLHRD